MNKGRKHKRGGRHRHKGKQGSSGAAGGEDEGGPEEAASHEEGKQQEAVDKDPSDATTESTQNGSEVKASPEENGDHKNETETSPKPTATKSAKSSPDENEDPAAGLYLPEMGKDCPFIVRRSDIMGRYLVAARDLKPAEVVIQEEPLVVGPSQTCQGLCIGCYTRAPDDKLTFRCERCGWPLCNRSCPGRGKPRGHSAAECAAWAQAGLRSRPPPTLMAFQAVMALRCLLLRDDDPPRWRRLCQMEAHNDIRKKLPELWRHDQAVVVERIREDWKMENRFTEEEIHTVCGYLEVNSFEVGQYGTRALYPSAFLMAHDCVPNTSHADDPDTFKMTVRASRLIPKGDSITLSYAYTLQGTMKRREHLRESKFFDCSCARCADITELGSMASALKCPKCPKGYLLTTEPLDALAPWRCSCKFELTADSVRMLVDRINDELEAVDVNDVCALEAFLSKYRNVLHAHHFLALGAKHSLAQLYGKAAGYTINELSDEQLERKRDLCQELMNVFDVLDPGLTRLRGVVLYELHAPILILATRGFEARRLKRQQLAQRLQEVVNCLSEAARILQLEPPSSSEATMGQAAADALVRMRDWQRVVAAQ